jgi:hypothetical protein
MRKALKSIALLVPPLKRLVEQRDTLQNHRDALIKERNCYTKFVPPGHYYSPIPSVIEVLNDESKIWRNPDASLPGIDLNIEEQFTLLDEFDSYYAEVPFKENRTDGLRYYFENGFYGYSDAIFLYCMIRHARPERIIEAGSGFSSCVILDTNDLFFGGRINCTFIEPYAEKLKSLLKESDTPKVEILESRLQDIPSEAFRQLQKGDILLIDSTHVSKIHSDVNYIIHEILPVLSAGVYVHIHDIFYPFEYPKEWLLEGRAWNEQYILRAFLEFNSQYKIVLFNNFLGNMYREKLESRFPLIYRNAGGSIWLRRTQL